MQGNYVVGDLAGLLTSYLDSAGLAAPAIRRTLAAIPPHSRMPMQQWWSLLDAIQALQPGPALGLKIGRQVRPEHSGVLGYLIMSCDTLGEALLRFQRYQRLLHNYSRLELHSDGEALLMSWDVDQGLSTQLSDEVFLSALVSFVRQITDTPRITPRAITFNHSVDFDPATYEELMGCPVSFGEPRVSIAIRLTDLALPINSRDPHLLRLLETQAAALVSEHEAEDDFLKQLKQILVELLPLGEASLERSARAMHVSTRTLHRRLGDRQTNFKAFLQTTREQLAGMYFADRSLSLGDIAFLLGYAEQSAFTRACRHWFGRTPRQMRQTLQRTGPGPGRTHDRTGLR